MSSGHQQPTSILIRKSNAASVFPIPNIWNCLKKPQSLRFLKYGMLLVLTVLDKSRHLSNFWCLVLCVLPRKTQRRFFHVFMYWGSTYLYYCDKYMVYLPTAEQAKSHQQEFGEAGLHGCVGSTDATHIGMLRCPFKLMNLHSGHKLEMPTRTYNLTNNHRRMILSTTCGNPGWWNDKLFVLYNDFVFSRNGSNQCKKTLSASLKF